MKNKFITLAGALALAVVIGTYYAHPLLAQVRAALVSDVDNPARNPVRLNILTLGTSDNVNCFEFGYTAPAGKRLVIDDISAATVLGSSSGAPHAIELIVSPAGAGSPCESTRQRIAAIPFRPPALEGGVRYFASAHESLQLVVDPGESIGGELRSTFSTLGARYRVYLSGHLVTLP